jgi:O-acetyl-ADP-ribose deacetylase (regulator of RNase III)
VNTNVKIPSAVKVEVVKGDLLDQPDLDLIVNAANTHMWHGGGIAGAIRRAGGPDLEKDSQRQRPVPTGGAITSVAGNLHYKAVVHAVGPIYDGGGHNEMELLRKAHLSALHEAHKWSLADGLRRVQAGEQNVENDSVSIGFPAISCGIFHFPVWLAAPIAVSAVRSIPANWNIGTVRFCLLDDDHVAAFESALEHLG